MKKILEYVWFSLSFLAFLGMVGYIGSNFGVAVLCLIAWVVFGFLAGGFKRFAEEDK